MDDGINPLILVSFWSSIGPLALVLLLIFMSAMISGSEVALFSLTPSQKNQLRESASSADRQVIELLEDPDRELAPRKLLATILIVNNAVNIAIVLLASQLTEIWFAGTHYPQWVMTVVDVFAITFVIVLFGEVVPKVYATTGNLQVARFMALPLKFLNRLCGPVTWILLKSSAMIERGVKKEIRSNISVDELGHALELTADDGRSEEENRILEGIVTFGGKEAGQIMTPRMQVVLLDSSMSFKEVLKVVRDKGFSRLPVSRDESPDKIEGFLFIKDLLGHLKNDDFHWQTLIKPPFFVPENKKIDDLLQEFQQSKIHLAVVVDEYGGTCGLVTLEDILEEIVGEISDEFDEDQLHYSKLDERTFVMEGKITLVDMYKILGISGEDFEALKGDSNSLAGFIIERLGRIPRRGEAIEFAGFHLSVENADKRRVLSVKLTLPESAQ